MNIDNLSVDKNNRKIIDSASTKPIIFKDMEVAKEVIEELKKKLKDNKMFSDVNDANEIKYYVYKDIDNEKKIYQYNIFHNQINWNMSPFHDVEENELIKYESLSHTSPQLYGKSFRASGGASITSSDFDSIDSINSSESECNHITKLIKNIVPNQDLQDLFKEIKMYEQEDRIEYLKKNLNIIVEYINNNKDILQLYFLINKNNKLKEFLLLFNSIIDNKELKEFLLLFDSIIDNTVLNEFLLLFDSIIDVNKLINYSQSI